MGTTGASLGSTNGQASGAALKSLYTQYKTDGKVDLQNLNNIMNIVALANGIQGLKGIDNKNAFYTDFATGLVLGSNNLITNTNSSAVTGILSGLADSDLSALTGVAKSAVSKAAGQSVNSAIANTASTLSSISEKTAGVANTVSTLSSIFGMLK